MEGTRRSYPAAASRIRLPLGTVTLLERPTRMATLISSARAALRSRGRQYQVRDMLVERDLAEASLRKSESKLQLAIQTAHLGTFERNLRLGWLKPHPPAAGISIFPLASR